MKSIEAVYERGVFRPLEPLALAEGARVSVWLAGGEALGESSVDSPPPLTARDLREWMQRRAAAGTLLDEAALDRLDAAQADPRRSPDRWMRAQATEG